MTAAERLAVRLLGAAPAPAQVIGLRWLVPALYARHGLEELLGLLAPPASSCTGPAPPRGLLSLVELLLRRLPVTRTTCLHRALIAFAIARRRGHPVQLVLGVAAPGGEGLTGHAWLEVDGVPLEPATRRYVETYRYPREACHA
jgi:hypothetical protein